MALPPSKIYKYINGSNTQIYKNLKKAGLLNSYAKTNKQKFVESVQNAKDSCDKTYQQNPGLTGPNQQDHIADALHTYLNDTGNSLTGFRMWDKIPFGLRVKVILVRIKGMFL